jgi:hypothetical protein
MPKNNCAIPILKTAAVFAVTLALAGWTATGTSAQSPKQFVQQVVRWAGTGQWEKMYNAMHPAEQRVLSYRDFHRCAAMKMLLAKTVMGVDSSSVRFVSTKVEPKTKAVTISGTHVLVQATVVSNTISINLGGKRITQPASLEYIVRLDGGLRWFDTDTTATDYKKAKCGIE